MNNKGWGLQEMLILMLILIGALIISYAILVSNLGYLVKEDTSSEFLLQYKAYENELEEAAKKYVTDNYSNRGDDFLVISYFSLKDKKYIAKMMDPNRNIECDGYVEVRANNYEGFLNCSGSYKTIGYDTN
jgi:competence protein ComGF